MEAMKSEYDSLIENNTWELVSPPTDHNVVSCKWVFVTKEDIKPDGTVSPRFKARLVARRFSQIEMVDFFEIYAPVVKFTSVRVILALVAVRDMELHQMDVVTAFLNGDLEEEVYMEQPRGFENGDPTVTVRRLFFSIYGLKQAHL